MKTGFISPRLTCIIFILSCIAGSITVCLPYAIANGDYVIICNASNSINSISSVNLKNIFLGKKVSWDNGNKITFVTLKDGEAHKKFLRNCLKKNPQQFKNYWKKMLFTGKGVIPKSFPDDSEIISFVSKNENAIGYLSKEVAADGIKIIQIAN